MAHKDDYVTLHKYKITTSKIKRPLDSYIQASLFARLVTTLCIWAIEHGICNIPEV